MTTSGGACALVGDYCEELGINLPDLSESVREEVTGILPPFGIVDNPMDATGQARQKPEISCRIIDILMAEEERDIFLFGIASLHSLGDPNFQRILEYLAEKGRGVEKNVGVLGMISESFIPEVLEYSRRNSIPILTGGYRGLLAIRHLIDYSRHLERLPRPTTGGGDEPNPQIRSILLNRHGRALTKLECQRILEISGIRSAESAIVSSPDEASEAARRIGYPVTLRADCGSDPGLKVPGVLALEVQDEASLLAACRQPPDRRMAAHPQAQWKTMRIQKMPPPGVEVVVEAMMDRQFGPAVTLRMGGLFAVVAKDIAVRIAPVDSREALEMIQEAAADRILRGRPGHPEGDVEALAETIVKISRLSLELRDSLKAMGLHPLIVLNKGEGVCAADFFIDLE
jgi:acetyltransferase